MKPASAPGYDRFKTIVTVILVVILILMLLRGCGTNNVPSTPSANLAAATGTNLLPAPALPTETLPAASPTETASPTPVPPTVAATRTETTVAPTATPASAATESPTPVPEQTTPTPAQNASCGTLAPSRLSVGQKARVMMRLNLRSSPSIAASILKVNPTNSQVEIIGGPTCEPVGAHAYLWWQIRLADGTEGWSAESPLNQASYFLQPLP